MNAVFADTSYYIALLSMADEHHSNAEKLASFLSDVSIRRVFIRFESTLRAMPLIEVISAGRDHFDRGMKLFLQRTDKSWSLVGCISFVVMQEKSLQQAWTSDHHFVQPGFQALLI